MAKATALVGDRWAAEELVQETFITAARHIGTFDGRYPAAWLATILAGHVRNYRRRRPPEVPVPVDVAAFPNPADAAVASDSLARCLAALSGSARGAMWLVYVEGRSVSAAAVALRVSVPAVKMRLARGRRQLARCLQRED